MLKVALMYQKQIEPTTHLVPHHSKLQEVTAVILKRPRHSVQCESKSCQPSRCYQATVSRCIKIQVLSLVTFQGVLLLAHGSCVDFGRSR